MDLPAGGHMGKPKHLGDSGLSDFGWTCQHQEPMPGKHRPRAVIRAGGPEHPSELQRTILETAGYVVVTARDGRHALAALDRDADIALVVTDLEMPGLDGLGLTRAIRADAARSSLPVVIVTLHGSQDDVRKGVQAGADAYMAKRGFDQQALLSTVERLVGR